jgi:AraC-like DNA-binding protein
MSAPPLVNMAIVRPVIMAAVDAGASLQDILVHSGLEPVLMTDPQARITLEQRYRILETCERLTGDIHLGLVAGQSASPMILGMAGHLMETSSTMREAMAGLVRFSVTFSSQIGFSAEEQDGRFSLNIEVTPVWEETSPGTVRVPVDLIVSSAVFLFKLLSGRQVKPLDVNYRYPSPGNTSTFTQVLRVAPNWQRPRNQVIFSSSDMDLPVIGHNPDLNLHFQRILEKQLAHVQGEAGFAQEVYRVILQHYRFLLPRAQEVAAHLHMTPRTLQRKLAAEGTTFQQVADRVRRELSFGMLANQRLTVAEVAYKLGYSEPAAFQRAFKQWTGSTPKRYRVAQLELARSVAA